METRIENVTPYHLNGVILRWGFRLHMTEGAASAFDDFYVRVPPGQEKALGAWKKSEVDSLIGDFIGHSGLAARLAAIVEERKIQPVPGFKFARMEDE
ncbi:MAG: hypothetical protein ACE5IM_11360 [Nitrospinota bacterium]